MMTRLQYSHDTQVPMIHSPSPQPFPQRRGSCRDRVSQFPTALDSPTDGREPSLSLGERVGVRGNRSCGFRWVQLLSEAPIARRLAAAFALTDRKSVV